MNCAPVNGRTSSPASAGPGGAAGRERQRRTPYAGLNRVRLRTRLRRDPAIRASRGGGSGSKGLSQSLFDVLMERPENIRRPVGIPLADLGNYTRRNTIDNVHHAHVSAVQLRCCERRHGERPGTERTSQATTGNESAEACANELRAAAPPPLPPPLRQHNPGALPPRPPVREWRSP